MLLLQFTNENGGRLVGLLQDDVIRVIEGYNTTYALAQDAIRK
ncbi:FAH family protein, partial [Streptococcus danieliae]|nr:FAH family protein [Streptococcus danieliae]